MDFYLLMLLSPKSIRQLFSGKTSGHRRCASGNGDSTQTASQMNHHPPQQMANHSNYCVSHQTSTLNPHAPPFVSRSTTCLTSHPIACIDARSLRNKCAELVDFCATHSLSILCCSETWLSPNIPLAVPDYSVFRRDRPAEDNLVVGTDARAYGRITILAKSGMFTSLCHRTDLFQVLKPRGWKKGSHRARPPTV